jgi:hypothetical protein
MTSITFPEANMFTCSDHSSVSISRMVVRGKVAYSTSLRIHEHKHEVVGVLSQREYVTFHTLKINCI